MRTLWSWLCLVAFGLGPAPDEEPGGPSTDGAWQIDPLG